MSLAATLALAIVGQAYAAPLDLPNPARVELRVTRSREDIRAGKPPSISRLDMVYDKTIEAAGEGYSVKLKPTITMPSPVGGADAEAALLAFANRPLAYSTDDSLTPEAMTDWPAMLAAFGEAFRKAAGDDPERSKAMEATVSMFEKMTPEQAASVFLKDEGMLAIPINAALESGKPFLYEDSLPNPLGGPAIKANGKLSVETADNGKGVAVLHWSLDLDPKSTAESVGQMAAALMARMGPEGQKPDAKAIFARMSIERSSRCRYEVSLKTGLPLKADCEVLISVTDPSGEKANRNERWVMTQTLQN